MAPTSNTSKFFFYKWSTFAAMYVGYTLLVLNRKSFSFALPAIVAEVGLTKGDLGLISSSQNLAYSVSKFLGGIFSDSVSSKAMFGMSLLLAGSLTATFTAFDTVGMFAVLWFCQGFVQGGGWPSCAKVLRRWSHPREFGTMWSILSSGMNVACCVGPLVTTAITVQFRWNTALVTWGVLAIVTALGCVAVMVDSPTDVGFQSFVEEDKKDEKGRAKGSKGRGTWQDMLKSPFMWTVCAGYLIVFMVRTASLDWGQLYLIEEAGQSQYVASSFVSSLELGGFIGTITAGYLGDRLVEMSKRDDTRGTPRMTVVIMFVIGYVISLHCFVFTVNSESSQMWISLLGFLLGFGLYGPISLYGVMAIEAAPTHLSGTSHAIVSLASNVGAILAGLPLSFVARQFHWSGAFVLLEILSIGMLIMKILTRNLEYKMIPIRKKMQ